jgi:hypothetical protein
MYDQTRERDTQNMKSNQEYDHYVIKAFIPPLSFSLTRAGEGDVSKTQSSFDIPSEVIPP